MELRSSSGLPQGQGSGCRRPGSGISLLEEVTIYPTREPPEFTQDWGNRLLEGTNKTLCAPGPRRKEQCPHKTDWPRLACECPGVSGRGVGQQWPDAELGAVSAAVRAWYF